MISGIAEKRAIEDFIVVRDDGGNELRRLAMSDALRNVNWPRLRKTFWARDRERGYGLAAGQRDFNAWVEEAKLTASDAGLRYPSHTLT